MVPPTLPARDKAAAMAAALKLPCTRRRLGPSRRNPGSWLGSGTLAAHRAPHVPLLPSGPDGVGGILLRKTQPSTPLAGPRPHKALPRTGIRPRYSGLRVQGTATSPSSTAKGMFEPSVRTRGSRPFYRPFSDVSNGPPVRRDRFSGPTPRRAGPEAALRPRGRWGTKGTGTEGPKSEAHPSCTGWVGLAEGVGFEPTEGTSPSHALQACRFVRSRIPPGGNLSGGEGGIRTHEAPQGA